MALKKDWIERNEVETWEGKVVDGERFKRIALKLLLDQWQESGISQKDLAIKAFPELSLSSATRKLRYWTSEKNPRYNLDVSDMAQLCYALGTLPAVLMVKTQEEYEKSEKRVSEKPLKIVESDD